MTRVRETASKWSRQITSFRSSYKRLAFLTSGLVLTRGAALLLSVLIARASGASTFGEFTLFVTVFTLVSEIGSSLDVTYLRQFGCSHEVQSQWSGRTLHLAAKLVYASGAVLVVWLASEWVAAVTFSKPDSASLLVLAALSGGLVAVFSCAIAWCQGSRRFGRVALLQPVFNVTVLVVVAILIVRGWTITQADLARVYVGTSAILATAVALGLVMKRKDASGPVIGWVRFARTGAVLLGSSALILASTRLDVLMLPRFVEYEAIGHYGAALRIALLLGLVQAATTTLIMPSAVDVAGDRAKMRRYMTASALFVLAQAATALVLILLRGPTISIAFGSEYAAIGPLVVLLVLQSLLSSAMIPLQALIQCGARPQAMLVIAGGRLVVSMLLLANLIPKYGVMGAGIAMLATSVVILIAMALEVGRTSGLVGGSEHVA